MDFQIREKHFVVTGAGSGFGRAIAEKLLEEGAYVLAVARTKSVLEAFQKNYPKQLSIIAGDITTELVQNQVIEYCKSKSLVGVLVNAGGPPAKAFLETTLEEWDQAYHSIVRWKVAFVQQLIPFFKNQGYGRVVFIESISVKQPVESLVLSNSLRLAVVGFVKSLALDLAKENITLNILAPGYHKTAAMERLFKKKSEMQGITIDEAEASFVKAIPVGEMGAASDMASLALWLLSPHSRFVTGQTISHDGGMMSGIFG